MGGWVSPLLAPCCARSRRGTLSVSWPPPSIGFLQSRGRLESRECAFSLRRKPSPLGCPNGWKPGGRTLTNPLSSLSTSGEERVGRRREEEVGKRRGPAGAIPGALDSPRPRFFGWALRTLSRSGVASASGHWAHTSCNPVSATASGSPDAAGATIESARGAGGRRVVFPANGYADPAPSSMRLLAYARREATTALPRSAGNDACTVSGCALRTLM
jgi:hypothetical protein